MTVADVITNVRRKLKDVSTDSTQQTYSDELLIDLIDEECRNIWNYMLRVDPTHKLTKKEYTAVTDAVAGSDGELYVLPTDFFKFVACVWVNSGIRYPIEPRRDQSYLYGLRVVSSGRPINCYFKEDNIGFLPKPESANTIELWYTPKFTKLTAMTGTIDSIFLDYINMVYYYVTFMAFRIQNIESGLGDRFELLYDREWDNFRKSVVSRGDIKQYVRLFR